MFSTAEAASPAVSYDQELRGVDVQDRRRRWQNNGTEPDEAGTAAPDQGDQGHEQIALPQARRGAWLRKHVACNGAFALSRGAQRVTQTHVATETHSADPG